MLCINMQTHIAVVGCADCDLKRLMSHMTAQALNAAERDAYADIVEDYQAMYAEDLEHQATPLAYPHDPATVLRFHRVYGCPSTFSRKEASAAGPWHMHRC